MIVVCGDFHGDFRVVNQLLNGKREISMILQCGDFGWWPRINGKRFMTSYGKREIWNQYGLKNKKVPIYWCPGNHEDWESLTEIEESGNTEVMPNVFYMPRSAILILKDKRKVLFMGGGLSIDRKYRDARSGSFGWFWEETISQKDIEELPDTDIDIIISHTAPNEFKLKDYHEDFEHRHDYAKDPSRDALSYVLQKYNPKLWYFGHMHQFQHGNHKDCRWFGLSAIGFGDRWWIPLEEKEN